MSCSTGRNGYIQNVDDVVVPTAAEMLRWSTTTRRGRRPVRDVLQRIVAMIEEAARTYSLAITPSVLVEGWTSQEVQPIAECLRRRGFNVRLVLSAAEIVEGLTISWASSEYKEASVDTGYQFEGPARGAEDGSFPPQEHDRKRRRSQLRALAPERDACRSCGPHARPHPKHMTCVIRD